MAVPVFLEMVHGGHCRVQRQPWGFLALPLSPTVMCLSQSLPVCTSPVQCQTGPRKQTPRSLPTGPPSQVPIGGG